MNKLITSSQKRGQNFSADLTTMGVILPIHHFMHPVLSFFTVWRKKSDLPLPHLLEFKHDKRPEENSLLTHVKRRVLALQLNSYRKQDY